MNDASEVYKPTGLPFDFCASVRAKHAGGQSEKNEENRLAEDFLRSYLQTKAAENSSR